jgi:hypothetical protein
MTIPKEHEQEFARFPAVLRDLVAAELAAGNAIAEFAHGFPAAPCGAYIQLARPVTSRPRQKTPELDFYDRHGSDYSGEFTDDLRHFFVLEPPHPPEPEPDMDAIRAGLAVNRAAPDPSSAPPEAAPKPRRAESRGRRSAEGGDQVPAKQAPESLVSRFRASMTLDYEKWHDGIGYDLELLGQASPEELEAIEALLLQRNAADWRDVEALAALDSERARKALKAALNSSSVEVRMAVHAHAPELLTEAQRSASLVQALEAAESFAGLSQTLLEVEDFHPPEVVAALLRGLLARDGGTACHYAAMLYFLHGQASSPFDWAHRPVFLRFNTDDRAQREQAARELCATIGVDPRTCMEPPAPPKSPTRRRRAKG